MWTNYGITTSVDRARFVSVWFDALYSCPIQCIRENFNSFIFKWDTRYQHMICQLHDSRRNGSPSLFFSCFTYIYIVFVVHAFVKHIHANWMQIVSLEKLDAIVCLFVCRKIAIERYETFYAWIKFIICDFIFDFKKCYASESDIWSNFKWYYFLIFFFFK